VHVVVLTTRVGCVTAPSQHDRCPLSPHPQAAFRRQGQSVNLYLKEPLLSVMRSRRKLSCAFAPAAGNGGLPEVTQDLGDYWDRHRPPPPSKRVTRAAGSGDHGALGSSDGGGTGDDPQAQGMRTRKRSAATTGAVAAGDADANAPPAKKGRGQPHEQVSSGAAKATQKRKAPNEQPPEKTKSALHSKYRGACCVQLRTSGRPHH
jgi:hypothetical protein